MAAKKAPKKTTGKSAKKGAKKSAGRKAASGAKLAGRAAVSFRGNKITIADPAIIEKLTTYAKTKPGVPFSAIITLKKNATGGRRKESGTDAIVDVRC